MAPIFNKLKTDVPLFMKGCIDDESRFKKNESEALDSLKGNEVPHGSMAFCRNPNPAKNKRGLIAYLKKPDGAIECKKITYIKPGEKITESVVNTTGNVLLQGLTGNGLSGVPSVNTASYERNQFNSLSGMIKKQYGQLQDDPMNRGQIWGTPVLPPQTPNSSQSNNRTVKYETLSEAEINSAPVDPATNGLINKPKPDSNPTPPPTTNTPSEMEGKPKSSTNSDDNRSSSTFDPRSASTESKSSSSSIPDPMPDPIYDTVPAVRDSNLSKLKEEKQMNVMNVDRSTAESELTNNPNLTHIIRPGSNQDEIVLSFKNEMGKIQHANFNGETLMRINPDQHSNNPLHIKDSVKIAQEMAAARNKPAVVESSSGREKYMVDFSELIGKGKGPDEKEREALIKHQQRNDNRPSTPELNNNTTTPKPQR